MESTVWDWKQRLDRNSVVTEIQMLGVDLESIPIESWLFNLKML